MARRNPTGPTRRRAVAATVGVAAIGALAAACVPPPPPPPPPLVITPTPTTTTAPPAPVPELCSETGQAPADALAAEHAAARATRSTDEPDAPRPLAADEVAPALDPATVREEARRLAVTPGAPGPVALTVSATFDGRPVIHNVVDADAAAAVDAVEELVDGVVALGGRVIGIEWSAIVDMTASYPVDDAYRDEQWPLDRFDLEDTWCASTGAGVDLAVVDSGVDADHPDLSGRVAHQVDLSLDPLLGNGNTGKPSRHGTHVAGTIAAIPDNSIGTAGAAPGVTLMDVKALTTEGMGNQGVVARAIVHAVDRGAEVINLSVGFPCDNSDDGRFHAADPNVEFCATGNGAAALEVAAAYAKANDVVMVVAAGNDGSPTVPDGGGDPVANPMHNVWNVPGAMSWSLTVGSVTSDGALSPFSTQASYVDIAGPGSDVLSTTFDDDGATWETMSGTSMATPHVASLVAILRGAFPDESAGAVVDRVTASAGAFGGDGCPPGTAVEHCVGAGVMDPGGAVRHGRV